jgi:hypothetical protein
MKVLVALDKIKIINSGSFDYRVKNCYHFAYFHNNND